MSRGDVAGDRRAVRITITAAGRKALAAAEQAMDERLQGVLMHCEDRRSVEQALEQLGHALDAALAERLSDRDADKDRDRDRHDHAKAAR